MIVHIKNQKEQDFIESEIISMMENNEYIF